MTFARRSQSRSSLAVPRSAVWSPALRIACAISWSISCSGARERASVPAVPTPPAPPVAVEPDAPPPRTAWRATSSSLTTAAMVPALAIDGDVATKWGGPFSANHWWQLDLSRPSSIAGAIIRWDSGFARKYVVQSSLDGVTWTTAYETADSVGGIDYVVFPAVAARYVRLASVPRTADWGVSVFEFEPIFARDAPRIGELVAGSSGVYELTIDLPRALPVAGLEVWWGAPRSSATLEHRDAAGSWAMLAEDPDSAGETSFLAARESHLVSSLRLRVHAAAPPVIARLRLLAPTRVLTPMKRYQIAASRTHGALFPASLRDQQVYWTVVGVPAGRQKSVFDEWGNIEPFKAAPLIQPIWRDATGRTAAAHNAEVTHSLRAGWMPMPAVQWTVQPGLELRSEAIAVERTGGPVTLVRYRLRNTGQSRVDGALALVVRPIQVSPPWQNGGLAAIREISIEGGAHPRVHVNGRVLLQSLTPSDGYAAAPFGAHGEHELTASIAAGTLPDATSARDDDGLAAGAVRYRVELAPGATRDIVVAIPLGDAPPTPPLAFDALAAQVERQWQARVGTLKLALPDRSLVDMLRAQAAYMLLNQTGHALQPGPRNYNRSFIRDGSATAAILLRMGMAKQARDYPRWYTDHALHPSGLVSPILNDDGTVNTGWGSDIEYDSQGQLIFLVAEVARLDGGAKTVADYHPKVKLALAFLQELRERTMVPGYMADHEAPGRFHGILAPSISHEGYPTPTHSYWDDYWALKGWHDGAWLAEAWGDREMASWARAQYTALRASVAASIRATMSWKGIDFIPSSADLGDPDPTGVSIGLDPTGQQDVMPPDALARTFERYLDDVRNRSAPGSLYAYTPYELRNVLSYVHLGEPEHAHELLTTLLGHRRPFAWQVLAEVVYSDPRHAIYLGDMPHTWIGAEYARAVFGMLMHEADDRLRLLPGTPPAWLAGQGLRVSDLPTAYGQLSMSARADRAAFRLRIEPGLRAGTVLHVSWPERRAPAAVTIDGVARKDYAADGIVVDGVFKELVATW